jgi:hypothetical protein
MSVVIVGGLVTVLGSYQYRKMPRRNWGKWILYPVVSILLVISCEYSMLKQGVSPLEIVIITSFNAIFYILTILLIMFINSMYLRYSNKNLEKRNKEYDQLLHDLKKRNIQLKEVQLILEGTNSALQKSMDKIKNITEQRVHFNDQLSRQKGTLN